jgi:hypothetical protein
MSGKGSAPRPFDVPREQYENNFDRIFRSKQEPTPEEEEAWQELEHKPVYAVQDLGELELTVLPDEVVIPQELFEAICEMERENLMLRARNERLQARLRELTGEEMP